MNPNETQADRLRKLIEIGELKPADRDYRSIDQYLANARDLLDDVGRATSKVGRFLLAYEGIHCVALAYLEHLGVRYGEGDGHRMKALQLAFQELGIEARQPGALRTVMDIHQLRNQKTYRRPYPPIPDAAPKAAVVLLSLALPIAQSLAGKPGPDIDDHPSGPGPK